MEATTSSSSSPNNNADVDLSSEQQAPAAASWRNDHKRRIILSKQLSMCEEAPRNMAWERRRRQFFDRRKINLTDDDLKELKGCIELGFGFNQKNGQQLCTTIPALDLYFEVTRRKLSSCCPSPVSSPVGTIPSPAAQPAGPLGSPLTTNSAESKWKIFSPGDDPQQVKTRLRHWAQAVACSVMQSPSTEKENEMER
ncbi:hypothetical protein CASFOL_032085 [Castilleja foliolosa]|uniref:Uncharacterized protein n=1 Tax=Castilleja foliolosa TaxID=1961234 RepID=A0ABD3C1E1_9LAMI